MRILIISPFAAERLALEELLRGEGNEVRVATSREEGVRLVEAAHPDVLISDAQVPELDVPALMGVLAARRAPPRLILLCSRARCGPLPRGVVCLTKPIDLDELIQCVAQRPDREARVA